MSKHEKNLILKEKLNFSSKNQSPSGQEIKDDLNTKSSFIKERLISSKLSKKITLGALALSTLFVIEDGRSTSAVKQKDFQSEFIDYSDSLKDDRSSSIQNNSLKTPVKPYLGETASDWPTLLVEELSPPDNNFKNKPTIPFQVDKLPRVTPSRDLNIKLTPTIPVSNDKEDKYIRQFLFPNLYLYTPLHFYELQSFAQEKPPTTTIKPEVRIKEFVSSFLMPNDNVDRQTKFEWLTKANINAKDWLFVDYILTKESNWRYDVENMQGSSAYGLCQTMLSMHDTASDFKENPITQLKWCQRYAFERYGSWEAAYQFWLENHWW